MEVQLDAEVKSINFKPIRKNKSEVTITFVAESYNPKEEFGDLMNKNGKMVKVVILESEFEDAINAEPRDR